MAAAQKFMFGRDFAEEPVKARPAASPEPAPRRNRSPSRRADLRRRRPGGRAR